MSWHTPERKTEQAIKTYLQAVLDYELNGVQIATRFSNEILTEPRVEIIAASCEPGEQAQYYTGNWTVSLIIRVVSHYDKIADAVAHDEIVGNILDVLLIGDDAGTDTLMTEINATQVDSDFTAQQIDIGKRENRIDEHSLITEQEMTLLVSPSKL